ncbi:MAG: TetR/AcrR family transcriptional regulator [Deltaproteobacteria bacterium]
MACPIDLEALAFDAGCQGERDCADMQGTRTLGRPKDLEKREAILDAAKDLFAARGLDGVPIEAIASAASVSKVTIYANFSDKTAILEAIVGRERARLDVDVEAIKQESGTLAERLTKIGEALVAMIADPRHMAMDRCLGLEAQRNPEMAQRFFESGPGRMRDLLADVFTVANRAGEISVENPRVAAEDLMGLWFGFGSIEKRFKCGTAWTKEALSEHIRRTVTLLLRGYQAN